MKYLSVIFVVFLVIDIKNLNAKNFYGEPNELILADLNDFADEALTESTLDAFNESCKVLTTLAKKWPTIFRIDLSQIRFDLYTSCKKESYSVIEAQRILKSPNFDANKPVVMYSPGWFSNVDTSEDVEDIIKAYNCRGNVNILIIDSGFLIRTFYSSSALNTQKIGYYVAKAIQTLTTVVPLENFHLIGHSLGSHIVGYAGKYYENFTGNLLPRITGLDPARPCFNDENILIGLQSKDAKFVDIIHSNAGVLGQIAPIGNADFYANGLNSEQPGCGKVFTCSHARSWQYYVKTVYLEHEFDFRGRRCNSYEDLKRNNCLGEAQIPMGYATPSDTNGIFTVDVNENDSVLNNKCGLCADE